MKSDSEWAAEFSSRWDRQVRYPAQDDLPILDLLTGVIAEARAEDRAEIARLQKIIEGLAARVAGQSELLSQRAECDELDWQSGRRQPPTTLEGA